MHYHYNTRFGHIERMWIENRKYVLWFLYECRKMVRFSVSNDHDIECDPTTSAMGTEAMGLVFRWYSCMRFNEWHNFMYGQMPPNWLNVVHTSQRSVWIEFCISILINEFCELQNSLNTWISYYSLFIFFVLFLGFLFFCHFKICFNFLPLPSFLHFITISFSYGFQHVIRNENKK